MEIKPSTSGQGGYRPGAGRPKGSMSKLAHEARERARASGQLPHEILLSIARGEPQTEFYVDPSTGNVIERMVSVDIEQRKDAAKAAAPYYAPKISTVEVISGVADNELDAIIKQLAAEAGVDTGTSGEEPEDEGEESPTPRRRAILNE